jgi:hypothetical protein
VPRKSRPEIYIAKRSFSCEIDGEPVFVVKGERARAGHPILRVCAEHFEPADEYVRYDVEQATAAPGERRP